MILFAVASGNSRLSRGVCDHLTQLHSRYHQLQPSLTGVWSFMLLPAGARIECRYWIPWSDVRAEGKVLLRRHS